jgi:hypothetical protein
VVRDGRWRGQFIEVTENRMLASTGAWDGIAGQTGQWPSRLRIEFHDEQGNTRLVAKEGPHPPGTADMGRQAWEMMLPKLDSVLADLGAPPPCAVSREANQSGAVRLLTSPHGAAAPGVQGAHARRRRCCTYRLGWYPTFTTADR